MNDQKAGEQSQGKVQIKQSMGLIDAARRAQEQDILAIKLKNETKQKQTRADELLKQDKRSKEIMDEAKASAQKNAALEMRWNELKDLEECEELSRQIEEQNRVFNEILRGKSELIKEFWQELKRKDDNYIKMLKDQSDDIKNMITKMRIQFWESRDQCLRELDNIESKFEQDRKNLFEIHQDEVATLFKRHREAEEQAVTKHSENDDQNNEKIEELRIKGAKDYAQLKIQMEGEIQNLEKCLEDMKALYILNTEKLDYNLKVLMEKQTENNTLSDELKRKESNLDNRLRNLTRNYIIQDKEFKKNNKNFTQDYKRITRQFKELQKKFKHFYKADFDKYNEIQKMNEEEVKKYKEKIRKCDITIHIQQLGIQWTEPEDENENNEQQQQQLSGEKQIEEQIDENEEYLIVSEGKLQEIMIILMEEADFLIDDRMREELDGFPADQQVRQKLETIKKCIGIDSIEEMNLFLEELIKSCRIKTQIEGEAQNGNDGENNNNNEDKKGNEQEKEGRKKKDKKEQELQQKEEEKQGEGEGAEEVIDYEEAEINQNELLQFLINWCNDKEMRKQRLESMSTKKQVKQESERERKVRIAKQGKIYWEKLTKVLPDRTFRVWKVLDKSLSTYYELLLNRQKLIEETGELHNQNEELKNLLNQYLQINHELQIPPTRLINLEPNN